MADMRRGGPRRRRGPRVAFADQGPRNAAYEWRLDPTIKELAPSEAHAALAAFSAATAKGTTAATAATAATAPTIEEAATGTATAATPPTTTTADAHADATAIWEPPALPGPPPAPSEADAPPLRLRSAEGHLFEVPQCWLWRSPIIRDLAQDGDADEEIPLPKASTSAVETFLAHCEMYPAFPTGYSLRCLSNVPNDVLGDILWILKALDIYAVMLPAFVDLMSERDEILAMLSYDFIVPLVGYLGMHQADISENFPFAAVFRRVGECSRMKQHAARSIDALRPFLSHPAEPWRAAALEAMQEADSFEALSLLLQHRDFAVRSRACQRLARLPPCEAHLGVLSQYLSSSRFELREVAVKAIPKVAPPGCQLAIDILIDRLTDSAREVREAVVETLPKFVTADDQATIAKVMKYTVRAEWPTRSSAMAILAVIAPSKVDDLTDMVSQMQATAPTMYKLRATRILERLAPEPEPLADSTADSSGSSSGSGCEGSGRGEGKPVQASKKERNVVKALRGKGWADFHSDDEDFDFDF